MRNLTGHEISRALYYILYGNPTVVDLERINFAINKKIKYMKIMKFASD